jgi:hypothetical protein
MLTKIKTKFSALFNRFKVRARRLKTWAARHKLLTFAAVVLGLAVVVIGVYLFKRTPAGERFIFAIQALQRRLTGWFKGRANVIIVATAATSDPKTVAPAKPSANGK